MAASNGPITIDLQALLSASWRQFVANMPAYVLGFVVVALGGALSLGILVGPLGVGFIRMVDRGRRGEAVAIGDVLDGMRDFVPAALTALILTAGALLGALFIVLPGVVLAFLWSYCLYFVALRQCGPFEALSRAWDLAKNNVGSVLLILLTGIALNAAGAMVAAVGVLITMPFSMILMTRSFAEISPVPSDPAALVPEAAHDAPSSHSAAEPPQSEVREATIEAPPKSEDA